MLEILITYIILFALMFPIFWFTYFGLKAKIVGNKTIPYEQHPANTTRKVLCVGDSLGIGVGASKPEFSIAGNIGKSNPTWDITNISKNGRRVKELLKYLEDKKLANYDLIVVMVGGMDIIKFTPIGHFKTSLTSLLALLHKYSDNIIFLPPSKTGSLPLYFPPFSQLLNWQLAKVVRAIKEISEANNCRVIDASIDGLLENKRRYFSNDLSHPNDLGYELWYGNIQNYFITRT